jgi:hypothetical protein
VAGRPKGSKNKNKKSLVAWLDGHGWRFEEKFKEAYEESSPEERLRFIGKCLPFLFQRVDNTPLIEGDVNVHVKGISSKRELMKAMLADPFMEMEEAQVIEVKGERNDGRGRTDDDGDQGVEASVEEPEGHDSGSIQEVVEGGSGEESTVPDAQRSSK